MTGTLLHFEPDTAYGGKRIMPAENGMPFVPMRVYYMYECDNAGAARGKHAHRALQQILICVRGACAVLLDDGDNKNHYRLESPDVGLHITPITWGEIGDFSKDAVLLVLASAPYDKNDYIFDYDEFVRAAKSVRL